MEEILIIGAGGFGREVLWTINDCNKNEKKYSVVGFIDDNQKIHNSIVDGCKVLGGLEWIENNYKKSMSCIIAIGETNRKKEIENKLKKIKPSYATIVHPSVISSKSITIGEGTIIQAGVILTINITIGKHVHINIDSTVGHDSVIGDFVTINPGVHVNGKTRINNLAYIGTGVVMKQEIEIGEESVVGAGSVVLEDVSEKSLYAGVPAKLIIKIS